MQKKQGNKLKWNELKLADISRHLLANKDRLFIFLLAGILLMVITIPTKSTDTDHRNTSEKDTSTTFSFDTSGTDLNGYAKEQEQRLSRILSQIDGAGEVEVMITLQSSAERILDKDIESNQESTSEADSQGGTRKTTKSDKKETTVYDGSSTNENPYVSKELSPRVEGVLVLAEGGGNAVVKENITEAVQALFDLEPHKIRIIKKQTNQ